MKRLFQSQVIVTGFAMFSMFFGAGNVVFPLALGQHAGDHVHFAIIGLLLTAVSVPFLGLYGMVLFEGDFEKFYFRIGRKPGFILITLIISLIGPFAAMPRTITLAHSAIKMYFPSLTLMSFSIGAGVLLYVLSLRENKIVSLLGYVLSPILLISLAIIIIKGLIVSPAAPMIHANPFGLFMHGLTEGYNTMDLLATGFFSYIVITTLKANFGADNTQDIKTLSSMTLRASIVGAGLLAAVYLGMSYVAAFHSNALAGTPPDELLSEVAYIVLGSNFGVLASIAVSFACLTTAMTLAAVCSDFLRLEIFREKMHYNIALFIILALTTVFANLGFAGVMHIIAPAVMMCYPAIIVLTISNILYKRYGFKYVKLPFYGTLGLTALTYFL